VGAKLTTCRLSPPYTVGDEKATAVPSKELSSNDSVQPASATTHATSHSPMA
jgi:hypothetical protein